MAGADFNPKVRFNDGEGLEYDDLNEMQHRSEARAWDFNVVGGALLGGGVQLMTHSGAAGADPYDPPFNEGRHLREGRVYTPCPMIGPIRMADLSGTGGFFLERGILAMKRSASSGTVPTGAGQLLAVQLDDEERDLKADIDGNAAPGAGNPRWDTWGFSLAYALSTLTNRDFQDAVTRAPTTASQIKQQRFTKSTEFVTGSQSATFDVATLTTGFAPILTKRRAVGESAPWSIDDFYNHVYPMRLGIEDVRGDELWDTGVAGWNTNPAITAAVKSGGGSGALYVIPRTMHQGCRLVGLGIVSSAAGASYDVNIGRFDYSAASGLPSFTTIVNVGASSPMVGTSGGFRAVGEQDWSPSIDKGLPIWGNGTTYGPFFADERKNFSGGHSVLRKLVVELNSSGWVNDDRIYLVRFYYLY